MGTHKGCPYSLSPDYQLRGVVQSRRNLMRRSLLLSPLVAAALASAAAAQDTTRFLPLDTVRVDSLVRAQMTARHLVGLSIGVLQGDRMFLRAYGTANRA